MPLHFRKRMVACSGTCPALDSSRLAAGTGPGQRAFSSGALFLRVEHPLRACVKADAQGTRSPAHGIFDQAGAIQLPEIPVAEDRSTREASVWVAESPRRRARPLLPRSLKRNGRTAGTLLPMADVSPHSGVRLAVRNRTVTSGTRRPSHQKFGGRSAARPGKPHGFLAAAFSRVASRPAALEFRGASTVDETHPAGRRAPDDLANQGPSTVDEIHPAGRRAPDDLGARPGEEGLVAQLFFRSGGFGSAGAQNPGGLDPTTWSSDASWWGGTSSREHLVAGRRLVCVDVSSAKSRVPSRQTQRGRARSSRSCLSTE